MSNSPYVLISACRNESAYIEGLIDNISQQTLPPFHLLIIDDSSTDDTYARAATKCKNLSFLRVAKAAHSQQRGFATKSYAANYGYELVKSMQFEFIGFIDADIRPDNNYYEQIIHHFNAEPRLGMAGGAVIDQYENRTENIRRGSEEFHVPGGVQFFRRECFEQIGGYVPIEDGGEDTIADVMTMMSGWKIKTIPDIKALHLRPEGTIKDNVFKRGMKWGRRFYLIGYHPLFYFGQNFRRIARHPVLIGSLCQFIGFIIPFLKAEPRPVSEEFVRFLRKEQMRRIRQILGF
jgi:glycosyltransferase involved in cell wall biosynthesis